MDGIGQNENGAQGFGFNHHFPLNEGRFMDRLNGSSSDSSSSEESSMEEDDMTDGGPSDLNQDSSDEVTLQNHNEGTGYLPPPPDHHFTNGSSLPNYTSGQPAAIYNEQPNDYLIVVSLSCESIRSKIIGLAHSAMKEISKMAFEREPLWQPHPNGKYDTINKYKYLCDFSDMDTTIREINERIKAPQLRDLPSFGSNQINEPETSTEAFQVESSRHIGYVQMNAVDVVEILMDLDQWSRAFCDIVSRAKILGTLSHGNRGGYDGELQVMRADFHMPTAFVPSRGCYFLRYSKQLSSTMWAVVVVSFDQFIPSLPTNIFRRRPSGCLIKQLTYGYSQVTWIEHMEADHNGLNIKFKPLVTSGFGFSATRWVASLLRHCEWSEALRQRSTHVGLISYAGKTSVLKLAERMRQNFFHDINASKENLWIQLPSSYGCEDVRFSVKNNVTDFGKPPGRSVLCTTSVRLPASPEQLFDFLRDNNSRNKWDMLSIGRSITERYYVVKGNDSRNRVSLLRMDSSGVDDSTLCVQDSHMDSSGSSYVIFAPIELSETVELLRGENPDNLAILPCGFAILPDGISASNHKPGSILTAAFHVKDNAFSNGESGPTLNIVHRIVAYTIVCIEAAVVYNN